MSELRIRNVDDDIVEALKQEADLNGRSLESELRIRISEMVQTKIADFPNATEWNRAGFDELYELIPGRQYIVEAAGMRSFRITLMESQLGSSTRWQTEIEEDESVLDGHYWRRAIDVPERYNGDTPAIAMRDCIRWLADYAGVDNVSRIRRQAEAFHDLPNAYQQVITELESALSDASREVRERSVVIFRTAAHEIYFNITNGQIALMVYPLGGTWSITNGKASFFELAEESAPKILEKLVDLKVIQAPTNKSIQVHKPT